jgi:hypothetical protein
MKSIVVVVLGLVAFPLAALAADDLTGPTTRAAVVERFPEFGRQALSSNDGASAYELAKVGEGLKVTVWFGTWCGDSQREVGKLFAAIDMAQGQTAFDLELFAVPRGLAGAPKGVRYMPTFIVTRGKQELGRIVESAPGGIVRSLLKLLSGEVTGVLSGRPELHAPVARIK